VLLAKFPEKGIAVASEAEAERTSHHGNVLRKSAWIFYGSASRLQAQLA
jgi:hypothetical protein